MMDKYKDTEIIETDEEVTSIQEKIFNEELEEIARDVKTCAEPVSRYHRTDTRILH